MLENDDCDVTHVAIAYAPELLRYASENQLDTFCVLPLLFFVLATPSLYNTYRHCQEQKLNISLARYLLTVDTIANYWHFAAIRLGGVGPPDSSPPDGWGRTPQRKEPPALLPRGVRFKNEKTPTNKDCGG